MHTILGAGGAIGSLLATELIRKGERVRLVGRHPKSVDGAAEAVVADVSDLDQVIRAVSGSRVVHLVVGLKYHLKVWRDFWPRIMRNTMEACKRAGARLIFFDNVYMYGRVAGAMTEQTPFNPCSRKGEIRARLAKELEDEIKAGNLTALIARSAAGSTPPFESFMKCFTSTRVNISLTRPSSQRLSSSNPRPIPTASSAWPKRMGRRYEPWDGGVPSCSISPAAEIAQMLPMLARVDLQPDCSTD